MKTRSGFVSNSSTTSFMVLGVKINEDLLTQEAQETVRGCKCKVSGEPKYCPECGAQFFKTVTKKNPAPGYDPKAKTFHGIPVVRACANNGTFLASFSATGGGDFQDFEVPENLDESREKMRKVLEPLGLWKKNAYKAWMGVTSDE